MPFTWKAGSYSVELTLLLQSNFQVRKVDPVPLNLLKSNESAKGSGDRVHLPYLKIFTRNITTRRVISFNVWSYRFKSGFSIGFTNRIYYHVPPLTRH